ncbi:MULTISPECIES: MAPEG family protein [Vitreoscilla]|uniref:MAPEG family protein n=1 Tax=Vitreoscilla stercoraria TaxID=61 RepID=A0ABY4E7H9_VITST|nr:MULTISPECIES: MAPEG family protein [Vitreoscilla]AUZ04598.2 hypothetical protein ADP71_08600 [Vitreoscilla sp. C1]UOO91705.1 MAPEG family protein [Vitreoscilla stercoraria]
MTLAYWCVFIAMFLPWLCAFYAKRVGGFAGQDNHNPRDFMLHTQGEAKRANAAQQNSFEIFPAFAAAVIIAHMTGGASQAAITFWSVLFVLSRLLYIFLYIKDMATLRSGSWMVGLVCILALFIAAA